MLEVCAQDGFSVLLGRFLDDQRGEAANQRSIFLNIAAVLAQGGGADAGNLATGQSRLEDVGERSTAIRDAAGANNRVEFVDEEDGVRQAFKLIEQRLRACLKLTAVGGAGHKRIDVELK